MFDKILVAVDTSGYSKDALTTARDVARLSGGQIRIVHVREMSPGKSGPVPKEELDEAQAVVDDAAKTLSDEGVEATTTIRTSHSGRVAAEIVLEASDWGAQLIIMATRGLTDLAGLVLGSTTHKVLHLSPIPVLVVR